MAGKQQQHQKPHADRNAGLDDHRAVGKGQAAHQPVDDGGKLVIRIGKILHQRKQRGKQRSANDAAQHQHDGAIDAIDAGDAHCDSHRDQPAQEGRYLHGIPAFQVNDSQRRAEGCAGQHAKQAGRNQRVDEHGLKGRSRGGKRGTDQGRRKNARQANFDQNTIEQTHVVGGKKRRPEVLLA